MVTGAAPIHDSQFHQEPRWSRIDDGDGQGRARERVAGRAAVGPLVLTPPPPLFFLCSRCFSSVRDAGNYSPALLCSLGRT